jgi:hypothetical protein
MPDQPSLTYELHSMLGIIAGIRAGYVPTPGFIAEAIEPHFENMTRVVKAAVAALNGDRQPAQVFDPEKVRELLVTIDGMYSHVNNSSARKELAEVAQDVRESEVK